MAEVTHMLAFDGTDQAECRGDDNEPCTDDPKKMTCQDCQQCLDDRGLLP